MNSNEEQKKQSTDSGTADPHSGSSFSGSLQTTSTPLTLNQVSAMVLHQLPSKLSTIDELDEDSDSQQNSSSEKTNDVPFDQVEGNEEAMQLHEEPEVSGIAKEKFESSP